MNVLAFLLVLTLIAVIALLYVVLVQERDKEELRDEIRRLRRAVHISRHPSQRGRLFDIHPENYL